MWIDQKKLISLVLITSIIAGILAPIYIKEAKADLGSEFLSECVGNFLVDTLGLRVISTIEDFLSPDKVPEKSTGTEAQLKKFELKQCLLRLKDLAIQLARNILKKRILDQLVDQLIKWIQNGEEPRFVSDFGGFIEDAKQAAIGDTLRDIGLGRLCDERLQAKLELSLGTRTPRQFSQQVTCTLDQVVGNISAFRDDFSKGGWLGIQEAVNPRNNIFGLKLMTMEKVIAEVGAREEAAKAEVAPSGFIPQKRCLEYELRDGRTGAFLEPGKIYPVGNGGASILIDENPVPAQSSGEEPGYYNGVVDIPNRAFWYCPDSKKQIVTPAQTQSDTVSRAVNLDLDYVLNADDLSAYLAAISDALINRITTETGKGLLGLFSSGNESPSRGGASSRDSSYITSGIQDASLNYDQQRYGGGTLSSSTITASKTSIFDGIAEATSSLFAARRNFVLGAPNASSTNTLLIRYLDFNIAKPDRGLLQCMNSVPPPFVYVSVAPIGPDPTSTKLYASSTRRLVIASSTARITPLNTLANRYYASTTAATTADQLYALSGLVNILLADARGLETESITTLNEVVILRDEARRQRDDCNAQY
ncbi:hypothetical protein HY967_00330 [Candidatus Jorgensenbacteria bacterium]|nr:hypothetical protein [Candidatus Jorgensenbacteria bacterium]